MQSTHSLTIIQCCQDNQFKFAYNTELALIDWHDIARRKTEKRVMTGRLVGMTRKYSVYLQMSRARRLSIYLEVPYDIDSGPYIGRTAAKKNATAPWTGL